MGKSKRGTKKTAVKAVYDSDDERAYSKEDVPDPQSLDFYHDEVDTFHADREKILLDSGRSEMTIAESSSDEEEVLGLGGESDDEMEMYQKQLDRFQSRGYHDDAGSDVEEDKADAELDDDKAWGKKKTEFYGADVSDDEDIDFSGSEPDTALLEEQEALAIQRRMAQQLAAEDFGLDLFNEVKEKRAKKQDSVEEKITKDLSKLSKRETLQLVKKESPELIELIEDFKSKMTIVRDRLMPLVQLIKSGSLQASSGSDYLLTKLHLYLNYCVNVNFYMVLKAKRTPVQAHPVIKRIVQYRNLIKELDKVNPNAELEISAILKRLQKGEAPLKLAAQLTSAPTKKRKMAAKEKRKLSELVDESTDDERETKLTTLTKKAKKAKGDRYETSDEKAALEYYEMMKGGRHRATNDDEPPTAELNDEDGEAEDEDKDDEDAKRGITYQIAKNKGMTPKRKKEDRNPRVKNRLKYEKAKVRRKGKIRPVVTEMHRYGGETSGIRAGLKKSVKFK